MSERDPFRIVGTTLGGKYAIEAVVDEGGFAVVYRAMHVIWRRPVAIKAFKISSDLPDRSRDALLNAFFREGALLAELSESSPAVCQARDVGTFTTERGEWVPYLVLEWLDGECLEIRLWHERKLGNCARTLEQAMRLLDPVAEALALAHTRGISHCDVKPGNIFVLSDPNAPFPTKLVDFGVAKVTCSTPSQETADVLSFTPAYGAPEQFFSAWGRTGPWTDVYALALLLVELMAGTDPLEPGDVRTFAAQAIRWDRRPTPRTLGVAVSDEVEEVFARALAVDPQKRYPNVGELWRALREAACHAAEALPRRRAKRSARRWMPLALAAIVLVSVVGVHASGVAGPNHPLPGRDALKHLMATCPPAATLQP